MKELRKKSSAAQSSAQIAPSTQSHIRFQLLVRVTTFSPAFWGRRDAQLNQFPEASSLFQDSFRHSLFCNTKIDISGDAETRTRIPLIYANSVCHRTCRASLFISLSLFQPVGRIHAFRSGSSRRLSPHSVAELRDDSADEGFLYMQAVSKDVQEVESKKVGTFHASLS